MRSFIVCLLLISGLEVFAQGGLETIYVEKYYISDSADSRVTEGGFLKPGSVTYRVWVDMKPGYSLQAVYGVPGHSLKLATSTYFFNNELNGGVVANDVPRLKLDEHTTMLDSWLSVGAGSDADFAVLKSNDNFNSFKNKNGILKNENPEAGIPLTKFDGLLAGTPQRVVSFFGMDTTQLRMLNNFSDTSAHGQSFVTENGSWASFGGAYGTDTSNKVLIAQLTTDGQLSFELNLQIGTPYGSTENYYAQNPKGSELQIPELTYPLVKNINPDIKWLSIPKNRKIKKYKQQNFKFLVVDNDNNIRKVDLYVNNTKVTESFTAPFIFNWNPQLEGEAKVYAIIYDYAGAKAKSEEVTFIVQP